MTKPLTYPLLAIALASLGGCFSMHAEGDPGPTTSKSLTLDPFDAIQSKGSATIQVTVGGEQSIKLEGSESRIKNLETKIVDGKLVIDEKSSGMFGSNGDLKITITVPSLKGFELDGSGDVTITGVKGDEFMADISGSGAIAATGEATTVSYAVSGSGEIIADGLKAKSGSVAISGSGGVNVAASDALTVDVTGSGDVTYFGSPKLTQSITGSGDVHKG